MTYYVYYYSFFKDTWVQYVKEGTSHVNTMILRNGGFSFLPEFTEFIGHCDKSAVMDATGPKNLFDKIMVHRPIP